MDKLKKFVNDNKEAFDNDLLPTGHFERFEKKLPVTHKKRQAKWINLMAAAVAASITILILLKLQHGMTEAPVQQSVYTCETQEEIDELRLFYNMQMSEMYARIRSLYKSEQIPGGLELLEETKRVLKTSEEFEENILPTLPCSEDGLFAMNQHYSNSLESLQIMFKQMEQVIDNNH